MSALDLDALRALAVRLIATQARVVALWQGDITEFSAAVTQRGNAYDQYILATKPDTVLALIAEAEAARRYREALLEIGAKSGYYGYRWASETARAALAAPGARQEGSHGS